MVGLLSLLMLFSSFLSSSHSDPPNSTFKSPDDCEVKDVNGFLMFVCDSLADAVSNIGRLRVLMKCIHSDQFYNISWKFHGKYYYITADLLCEKDPHFYQACAVRSIDQKFSFSDNFAAGNIDSTSGQFPCGFLCVEKDDYSSKTVVSLRNDGECGASYDCVNTVYQPSACRKGTSEQCDMICQPSSTGISTCLDESVCNGYSYGLWCDNQTRYVPVPKICDQAPDCKDGMDENICQVDHKTMGTCKYLINGEADKEVIIPLHNFTRCRPIIHHQFYTILFKYCEDYLDQTNCTDVSRVGLYCPIHGFMSTVARQVVCSTAKKFVHGERLEIPPICDDKLDKACVNASFSCVVHKHQLCDGSRNCQDNGDEAHSYCQHMTDQHCTRRLIFEEPVSSANLSIPMGWVHDGVSDCMGGEDESEDWPTCGQGRTLRFKDRFNSSCLEVFLCAGSNDFITFSRLCDKIDSCGNENEICKKSRNQPVTMQHALRANDGSVRSLYCLPGLNSILDLKNETCVHQKFIHFGTGREIFGKNHSLNILFPRAKRDCNYLYGESYVFFSCLQMCKNARCPLEPESKIRSDLCPGQFTKTKVISVDNHGNLAVLIKVPKTSLLSSDIFSCKDSPICLTYDKVCNLVDDCGDESDESSCDNHFQCETSLEFIPVNQKCDRIFHCLDLSDECNDSCGLNIINGSIGLKIMAWMIGILAIILNLYSLAKSIFYLKVCRSEPAFITNCLVILISIGDLLVGVYLTLLALFDSYHGSKHCKVQTKWLTSTTCVSLGIINSLGSEISLFSMTALSVIRALGSVRNKLSIPKDTSRKTFIKVISFALGVFLICFTISYWPLIKSFEDYFVNGIRYEKSNTLLIGSPGKRKHMAILGEYYGRMRRGDKILSWSQINYLMASMFSHDYGGIKKETLSFYGNDPVCVFKYFVRTDDPQRYFSLTILSLNCLCFVTIAVSYLAIAVASRNSIKKLKAKAENKTQNSDAEKRNSRLQRVVHMIVLSDFLCWIPFTFTCWLHFLDLVDAMPWYPTFSILVLPINSVVNPVLYDKSITGALDSVFVSCKINILYHVKKLVIFKCPDIKPKDKIADKDEDKIEVKVVDKIEDKIEDKVKNQIENVIENKIENKIEDDIEDKIEDKIEDYVENDVEEKIEVKIDDKIEVKIEVKIEEKIEDKIEEKIEDKIEEKIEDKIEEKIEVKIEEKMEEKIENKIENNIEEKIENKIEDKIEEKIDNEVADKIFDEVVDKVEDIVADKLEENMIEDGSECGQFIATETI